jgi:hypothetical protein
MIVEALCYKSEGRELETRRVKYIILIYVILLAALGPGIYSASYRKEDQQQTHNCLRNRSRPALEAIREPIV